MIFQDVPIPPDGQIPERGDALGQYHGEHRRVVRLQHHDQRIVALPPDIRFQVVHRVHQVDEASEGCTQPVEPWSQIGLPPGKQRAHQLPEAVGREVRVHFARPLHRAEAREGILDRRRLTGVCRADARQVLCECPALEESDRVVVVVPVVQALVVGQHRVHVRGVEGRLRLQEGLLLQRVHGAAQRPGCLSEAVDRRE